MAITDSASVVDRAAALSEAVASATGTVASSSSAPLEQSPPRAGSAARRSGAARRSSAAHRSAPRASTAGPKMALAPPRTGSSSSSSTVPEGDNVEGAIAEMANPRSEGMRYALGKFLELLDAQMTTEAMQSSLPMISTPVREEARRQMVQQLRDATKDELETVMAQTDLGSRLLDLEAVVLEAQERAENGLKPGDEELRDAWRPDLEIATAIHARSVPEQQARVTQLEATLAQIRSENETLARTLRSTSARADVMQAERVSALDTLDRTVAGLRLPESDDVRLRDAIDGMRDELGARR